MDDSNAIAFSDFSFFSKIIMTFAWLLKSCIVFSIFFVLIPLKYYLYIKTEADYLFIFAGIILAYCVAFLIYYVISEGILKDMFWGFVISIIGSIIAFFIPPVGAIIIIIGIISMIKKIISVVKMIPLLLFGFLLATLLFSDELFESFTESGVYINKDIILLNIRVFKFYFPITIYMFVYIILSIITSLVLSFKYSLKNAMMRQVVILMAVPITALIIWLIKTKLSRSLYSPSEIQQVSIHNGKIWIDEYFRSDGTPVRGHWRHLPHRHK